MATLIRETWLEQMIELLRPDFAACAQLPTSPIRVSCGFPSKSALARKAPRVGECWGVESSEDHSFQIFVSPVLSEGIEVAAVLVHELVHCAVGIECKHRGAFPKVAKFLGLEGKMTSTVAGESLKIKLKELIEQLGPYPHARLVASSRPKTQTTRQRKVVCIECGCICRMTAKWVSDVGCPTCGCGGKMGLEGASEGVDE